jgi:hypothetical protein
LKQLAIFVVPLYLILSWTVPSKSSPDRVRQLVGMALRIALIPAIASLPFLFWNPEGFLKSILFSFTRNPNSDFYFDVPSAGEVLGFHLPIEHLGLNRQLLRLPMLVFLGLIYVAMLRRELGLNLASLFVIGIFINLNPVFFSYYLAWIVPLIPLVARDFVGQPSTRANGSEAPAH